MKVECFVLSGKKLSVRVDGKEIVILPRKQDVTYEELEGAFQEVVDRIDINEEDW